MPRHESHDEGKPAWLARLSGTFRWSSLQRRLRLWSRPGARRFRASLGAFILFLGVALAWPGLWLLWPAMRTRAPAEARKPMQGSSRTRFYLVQPGEKSDAWARPLIPLPSRYGFLGPLGDTDEEDPWETVSPVTPDSVGPLNREPATDHGSSDACLPAQLQRTATPALGRYVPAPPKGAVAVSPAEAGRVTVIPYGALEQYGFTLDCTATNSAWQTPEPWSVRMNVEVDVKGRVSLAYIVEPSPFPAVNMAVLAAAYCGRVESPGIECSGPVRFIWRGRK